MFLSGLCKFEHVMLTHDVSVMWYHLYEFDSEHKLLPEHSKCVNKIYLSLVYFAMMITSVLACYLQVSSTVTPPSRVTQ